MPGLDQQGSSRLLKEVSCSRGSFKLNENGGKYHLSPLNSSLWKAIPNKNPGKTVHNPKSADGVIIR